jgi:hypothetical protein
MNNKQKIKQTIEQGASTSNFTFSNPGFPCNPYFGASTFYGEQSRLWQPSFDGYHREKNFFINRAYKAIGRQLMN